MKMQAIETARLRLRVFRPQDLDDHFRLVYGDAEAMRYIGSGVVRTRDETENLILSFIDYAHARPYSIWAVEQKADGQFIGQCGLIHIRDTTEVEIAYAFGRPYWGQGFATEAAYASLRYGFEQAGLPRLIALAYPENTASQRVMEKIGMRRVGTTSQYHGLRLVQYALENRDFRPSDAPYTLHMEADDHASN